VPSCFDPANRPDHRQTARIADLFSLVEDRLAIEKTRFGDPLTHLLARSLGSD